jgi:hypothetical protein
MDVLNNTADQVFDVKQLSSLLIKRSTATSDFKKPPDNVRAWNFSILVFKSKVPSGNDLLIFSLDVNPGKVFVCTISSVSKEFDCVVYEADEEIKVIFEKIKLYNLQQTISGKVCCNSNLLLYLFLGK